MIHGKNDLAYQELMLQFLPRPITTENDYQATQAEIDRLLDKLSLTRDEQDYLNLLGTLLSEYESRTEDDSMYLLRGAELVKALLDLHNLKQKDLTPIFRTKSITSEVLSGKRRLNVHHIAGLAAFFDLPHALFFEPTETIH